MSVSLPLSLWLVAAGCSSSESAVGSTTTGSSTSPPLSIAILEPAAGAHVAEGMVQVEGTQVGLTSVTLNGEPIDASSGTFSRELEVVRGINTIEARGEKGTTFRLTRRAVLAGTFVEPLGPIDEAVGVRVNQGGLDAVGGAVGALLDPAGLSASLAKANPVYESFVFDAHIDRLDFAPLRMEFSPAAGRLGVDVVLPELLAVVFIDTLVDFEIEVTADEARIGGVLSLGTDGQGGLTTDFTDASVSLSGFDYDTSLIPGDFSFGEGTVEGILEGVLLEQVEGLVPDLLDTTLSGLDLDFELDLLGTPVTLGTAFRSVIIDANGVQLVADVDVDVPAQGDKSAPGFLAGDVDRPTPNTTADLSMSLSDDLVNRLLFEVWNGGLVDQTLSTADGSLPAEYLESFGASEGELSFDAKLPPVLVQKGAETELQVGELQARLSTPSNPNFTFIDLALSALVPVDLEVVDGSLTVALGEPALQFVVRDTDWNLDRSAITQLLEEELPIDALLASLGVLAIELPEIAGVTLENASIERDPSGVFTNVAAAL